jgi:hypothetical protein
MRTLNDLLFFASSLALINSTLVFPSIRFDVQVLCAMINSAARFSFLYFDKQVLCWQ